MKEQTIEGFKQNKPRNAALHWDGKLIPDVTGEPQENEAILVSGAPNYLEGKILGVTKLKNEEGNPSSSGELQADAALEQIDDWELREILRALVFNTTASNTVK